MISSKQAFLDTYRTILKDTTGPAIKKRNTGSRSKNGCLICRQRRIKCDETFPKCNNCMRSGWTCSGPRRIPSGMLVLQPRTTPGTLSFQISTFQGNNEETRSFEFFCSKAVPELAVPFEAEFWSRTLLQISHNEPTVKHALIALSTLYEHFEVTGPVRGSKHLSVSDRKFALKHYNEAIHLLNTGFEGGREGVDIILVNCVLFVCLELLLGGVNEAIIHAQNGINIINTWREQRMNGSYAKSFVTSPNTALIEDVIVPIFDRLSCQAFFYGRGDGVPLMKSTMLIKPEPFTHITEANASFLRILKAGIQCVQESATYIMFWNTSEREGSSPPRLFTESDTLAALTSWMTNFHLFVKQQLNKDTNWPGLRSSYQLLIEAKIMLIWLTSGWNEETSFDGNLRGFLDAITLAESVYHDKAKSRNFSFNTGSGSLMYMLVSKCRDPQIRRRGLALMKNMPRREGFIDLALMTKIAEKKIEIEEGSLICGRGLPNLESRVVDAHTVPTTSGILVNFRMATNHEDGTWRIKKVYFDLSETS